MIRSSAQGKDETQKDQAKNDEHLDARQPEFNLAKDANTKIVDGNDDNQEDGDPGAWVDPISRNLQRLEGG